MNLIDCYGFSVDSQTMRVYLTEGKYVGMTEGIPTGADHVTVGADHGSILQKLKKVVINADSNLIYLDIAGKPYAGEVKIWEELPHDEQGRLLVDSVGKIVRTFKGLGFTEFGGVAMLPTKSLKAPKLNDVYPAKNDLVLDFDATQGEEALYYTGYAVGGGKTFSAEVYDPDEDLAITGLTEGVTYECYVTATDQKKLVSDPSNKISATCKSVIKAPVFKSCVAGDGFATVTFDPVTLDAPWTIDHYSYSAINMDDPKAPEIEGHIEDGKIILANDITWYVRICAVCNPGRVPGDFSDAMTVTPEHPSVPYQPNINTCYVQSNGQINVSWSKGANGNRSQSASVVDKWKLVVHSADGKGKDFEQEYAANVTQTLTDKVSIGLWEVTVLAHNDLGWSTPSKPAGIDYKPTVLDPVIGGQSYDDGTYKYCMFYSNMTVGYEAIRTKDGVNVELEVLLVGAGGAGKGQLVTFGKGGDGGGGQLTIGKLNAAYEGSIFVNVPNGGQPKGDSPDNTTVKEGSNTLVATAGKNATDKNDAAGSPRTQVPESWWPLRQFSWYSPESHFVGGVVQAGTQNYPSALTAGEGGAGTKDSNAGKGGESFVAIRWKK